MVYSRAGGAEDQQNETEGGRLVDGAADIEVEDPHRHHLMAWHHQEQSSRGLLEGQNKGEKRKGSSLPLTLIDTSLYLFYLFFNPSVTKHQMIIFI